MSNVFKASNSKVNTYRRCHQAYWLKYVEKLRRKRKARPLLFGSIVHDMLDAHKNNQDPFKVLAKFAREHSQTIRLHREEYGELVDDADCIMTEYFEHYRDDGLRWQPIKRKLAEHEFSLDVEDGLVITGRIDGFAKTKNGLRWLAEHKTFSRMPSEDDRWRNTQSPLYLRVTQLLGWPEPDGTMWDYIWSKPPSRPQLLKSGSIAQRSINTLPSRVIETLSAYKLSPAKYAHLIKSATKNRRAYFSRVFTPTKKRVVDMVYADFMATAREMRDNHGKSKARAIGRHCSWCEFEPICRASLTGGDVDFIKERDYEKREERHEVQAE